MKILITAFEPFGGRKTNTSAELLQKLRLKAPGRDYPAYAYEILPVNFRTAWPKLNSAIRRHRPKAIVLMGEKAGKRLAIETRAHNRKRSLQGLTPIRKSTASVIRSTLIVTRTSNFSLSNNAGTYLCNFVYYKTLSHHSQIPSLFVHVPALTDEKWQACQKSLTSVIDVILAQVTKAIDGTKRNGSKRENKKGAYHG